MCQGLDKEDNTENMQSIKNNVMKNYSRNEDSDKYTPLYVKCVHVQSTAFSSPSDSLQEESSAVDLQHGGQHHQGGGRVHHGHAHPGKGLQVQGQLITKMD